MRYFTIFLLTFQILLAKSSIVVRLYTSTKALEPIIINEQTNLALVNGFCFCSPIKLCSNYAIIHGFNSNGEVSWALKMKDKLLQVNASSNVFIIDWREGANTGVNYEQAAIVNMETSVSEAYNIFSGVKGYLGNDNYNFNVHCIGHSLGSHFCGFLSKVLINNLNLKFKRISALGKIHLTKNETLI